MLVVLVAVAGSLLLTPLAGALAWKCGAICRPDGKRKLHAHPTPLWGGSAVYCGAILGVIVTYKIMPGTYDTMVLLTALGGSAGLLGLLGCYDDRYDMRARWKLAGQIVATLPVMLAGFYVTQLELFGCYLTLGWVGVPITMGWLVLGINAMNLLDGMDGLASTVGIAISAAVAVIAGIHGQEVALLLALALAGGLVGFLVHNLPPAKIYLGDCGSMMIGLTLAVLAMQVSIGSPKTANVAIAGLLLFVPLLDTTLAIVRRAIKGNGLMVADRAHIHHRLLDRGYSIWQTLMLLGGLCFVAGTAACLAVIAEVELAAWALMASLTLLAVNRRLIGHEEWKLAWGLIAKAAARLAPRPSSASVASGLRFTDPASATPLPKGSAEDPLVGTDHRLNDGPIIADTEKKAA